MNLYDFILVHPDDMTGHISGLDGELIKYNKNLERFCLFNTVDMANFNPDNYTDKYCLLFVLFDLFDEFKFSKKIIGWINDGKLKLVIDRKGEFLNSQNIKEYSLKLKKLKIDLENVIFLSMNIGNTVSGEVGFDWCRWEVCLHFNKILDIYRFRNGSFDDFYFNNLRDFDEIWKRKPYKFICFNGTLNTHRVYILNEIINRNLDKGSIFSVVNKNNNTLKEVTEFFKEFVPDFDKKIIDNFYYKLPVIFDRNGKEIIKDAGHSQINPMLVDTEYLNFLKNSYFSFITESCMTDSNYFKITEKTWKVIGFQPFIVAGDKGILKYLQDRGFKTFPELFDESYDEISDNLERANFILDEVERVCNMEIEKLHRIYVSLLPKIKHNHKLMKNIDMEKFMKEFFLTIYGGLS